ncbi:MAG: HRDC domain-containing protein [Sodaliphilus sp.]
MQFKIFTIPLIGSEEAQEQLNLFLRAHRVAEVRKELGLQNDSHFWTFCISYLDDAKNVKRSTEKIDYKDLLSDEEFKRFSQMRKIRKDLAQSEAIPPFVVFTDAELAEFATHESLTLSLMRKVNGVGEKKLEKYGKYFVNSTEEDEASGTSD